MRQLTPKLKETALELGTAVVGIADAARYGEAPDGHRPEDIMEGATCVVSMGFLQPKLEKLCTGGACLLCAKACPVKAISVDGRIDKMKCAKYYRPHADLYKETLGLYFCRECRRVCPVGK